MNELKTPEVRETKKTEMENFKSIKPESGMNTKEAKSIWDDKFKKEAQEPTLDECAKDYIDDLKSKVEFPETIKKDAIDTSKLEKQTPEKVSELREEFMEKRDDLRNQWENENGKPWPRHTDYAYSKNGNAIRKPGDCYDAHHIQPLELGGKNEASNITPISMEGHKEIHSKDGSCTNLVKSVGGN